MNIITPQGIPSLTIGGRVFTDLTNLLIFSGPVAGAANGITTLRRMNASAGYQVTAGKTLYLLAIEINTFTAVATTALSVGYSDTDLGRLVNTAPTNPVYMEGAAGYGFPTIATGKIEYGMIFTVPATKYPFINNSGNATTAQIRIYGYEV